MPSTSRIVKPGPKDRTVITDEGELLKVPQQWELLPPGDAALTRRVKAAGPSWTMIERRGRRKFSKGVWASSECIARIRVDLDSERADPAYEKRRQAAKKRREKEQSEYEVDFRSAVLSFLAFAPAHAKIANRLATLVVKHAVPVGSGTVARTKRLSIERKAELAVIAWLRHQTTAYDNMKIPRIKGKRREVRRELARQSRRLLQTYRDGEKPDRDCPLMLAIVATRRQR